MMPKLIVTRVETPVTQGDRVPMSAKPFKISYKYLMTLSRCRGVMWKNQRICFC